jgi:hypothetical protein
MSHFFNPSNSTNITVNAPVLNISAYLSGDEGLEGGNDSGVANKIWVRANETFDETYIKEHGKCQNTGVGPL